MDSPANTHIKEENRKFERGFHLLTIGMIVTMVLIINLMPVLLSKEEPSNVDGGLIVYIVLMPAVLCSYLMKRLSKKSEEIAELKSKIENLEEKAKKN